MNISQLSIFTSCTWKTLFWLIDIDFGNKSNKFYGYMTQSTSIFKTVPECSHCMQSVWCNVVVDLAIFNWTLKLQLSQLNVTYSVNYFSLTFNAFMCGIISELIAIWLFMKGVTFISPEKGKCETISHFLTL